MSANPALAPAQSWLERNWAHVSAWIGGAMAFAAGFYDIEWGHQLGQAAVLVLGGGLAAFGVSGAFAAGVKVPTQ